MEKKIWLVNLVLGLLLLAMAALEVLPAQGAERYQMQVFLVEANGASFTKIERSIITKMQKLVADKAELTVTEISCEGKLKKLAFKDFQTGKSTNATVALFPEESGITSMSYFVSGGVFVSATPREALALLKQYL